MRGVGARLAAAAVALTALGAAGGVGEPLRPLPQAPPVDARRAELGARLFRFSGLSAGGRTSCLSCHDVARSGASLHARDLGQDGVPLALNTPTVFNATDSWRLNWEGRFGDAADLVRATLHNPTLMGPAPALARVRSDPSLAPALRGAYGRPAEEADVVDALTAYLRTLRTPDARFDLWLRGDRGALTSVELRGYARFKALGCAACHQGSGVGGNLFQRHGVFHPLGAPDPVMLRVPSLRNVAATAPYFHDGSAPTLEGAVRDMGWSQLDLQLGDRDTADIVAFLKTLSGRRDGHVVGAPPMRGTAP